MKSILLKTQTVNSSFDAAQSQGAKKWYATLLGVILFLSTTVLPIGLGLTTTRLALTLLIFFSLQKLFVNTHIPLQALLPFFVTLIVFIAALLSMLVNGGTVWAVVSWLMLGLLGALIVLCLNGISESVSKYIIIAVIFSYTTLMIYYCLDMYRSGVSLTSGFQIRSWMIVEIDNDPNRFNNSMFLTFAACFGALRFKMMKRFLEKALMLFSFILSLYIIVMSGSRQNLVACLIVVVLMIFMSVNVPHLLVTLFRRIPFLILMLFAVFMVVKFAINQKWFDLEFIQHRFVSNIEDQTISSSDYDRLAIAAVAIDCSLMNDGFGIGPGNFPPPGEYHQAHNGYLNYIAENGIIFGGTALLSVFIIQFGSFRKRRQKKTPLSIIAWAIFITIALILVNFKNLFQDPIYWSMFGFAIGSGHKSEVLGRHHL